MRIYFRKRPGFRFVRGGHVIDLQQGIMRTGSMSMSVDGVFGSQTEAALRLWQAGKGLPATGMVDELTWTGATGSGVPSPFRRCLSVTAAFEGHGYTFAAGNWDNAYLTWGVIGFTLKHGNLGKVIKTVDDRHPNLLDATIGEEKARELLDIISATAAEKKSWGNTISIEPRKYRIRADWEDAFAALGNRAEVRAVQDELARKIYWTRAISDLKRFGEPTETDAALFFDTAVQNGGVNDTKAELIRSGLAANPGASGRDRLDIIATAIADGSNPRFREDVLSRRKTIALGDGTVHGARYFLEDWAIDLVSVTHAELGG